LSSVLEVNKTQAEELLRLVRRHYPDLRGRKVTVLGLAFKPDTDDLRESPAFPVLRALRREQADITVFDPVVRAAAHMELQDLHFAPSLAAAVESAEIIIHVTKWAEFATLPDLIARRNPPPLVVDGRRNLPPAAFARYEGIGR
jgi:UDPglucose 6-dehydrogenase